MTSFLIARKSLRQHLLSTSVTALSVALAAGLLMTVWVVKEQSQNLFTNMTGGYDAVLGARGSKLQLVLNAVFHLESSPGNIPYKDLELLRKDRRVAYAVPIAVGDNYRGYRLVGTEMGMFDNEYSEGKKFQLGQGSWFDEERKEAVVGSFAARKLGLKLGDKFNPYHGLNYDVNKRHADVYVVKGVLEPTSTPADRVIWIPLAGLQTMEGHAESAVNDISAALVKFRSPQAGVMMEQLYNKQGNRLTLAWPIGAVMAQLFDKIGWFDRILEMVALLVAIVAAGSILASIYNSMNERRRDIAIMRALGARRTTIFGVILIESSTIATIGSVLGFAIYAVIMNVASGVIREQTGVVLEPFKWNPIMWMAPVGMIALGLLAGIAPAIKAYRTPVAEFISPVS